LRSLVSVAGGAVLCGFLQLVARNEDKIGNDQHGRHTTPGEVPSNTETILFMKFAFRFNNLHIIATTLDGIKDRDYSKQAPLISIFAGRLNPLPSGMVS
jgi:hypothetical protein